MNDFPDVMVDVETTGLRPDRAGMIQLAAVRFNLLNGTVDVSNMFNRCLALPPTRYWDEGTRSWWMKDKKQLLLSIMQRMEDPLTVMRDFVGWASPVNSLRFWSKPSHFDFNFVSSYCADLDVMNPFDFRQATDMRSYLRGLYQGREVPVLDLPFEGDAHNALFDVLHQIKELVAHQRLATGQA